MNYPQLQELESSGWQRNKEVNFDDLEKEIKERLADAKSKEDLSAKTDSAEAGGKERKLCLGFHESDYDEKFDEVKRELEVYKS